MSDARTDESGSTPQPERYELRVKGHLGPRWADWFDGMTLTAQPDGTTLLDGPVTDQSELHGVLRRLSDLGLTLVSVTSTATTRSNDDPTRPASPRRSST